MQSIFAIATKLIDSRFFFDYIVVVILAAMVIWADPGVLWKKAPQSNESYERENP